MIGTIFLKQYQAVSFLGQGSMGSVYLARHVKRSDVVVVKVMNRDAARDPAFRQFFDREIESLAELRHPCIVSLFDSDFNDPSGPCLVMEFIPGITLEKLLERHPRLSHTQVNRLLIPLCRALAYGHARQITHRDLKPANLMVLNPDTDRESVKVMDFGLAQLASKPHIPLEKLRGVEFNTACGTPIYVAPEGLRGDTVDHRADIYSLGIMLFEMLTGAPPFSYSDTTTLLQAHIRQPVPRFAQIWPNHPHPPEVEAIVRQCLEKYPNERPQTAREVAVAFGHALAQPLTADAFPPEDDVPQPIKQVDAEPPPEMRIADPRSVSDRFDAFMPEPIAVVKLRGFVEDAGGEILQSEPGVIRVQFSSSPVRPPYSSESKSLLGWLGDKVRASTPVLKPRIDIIEMMLYMKRKGSGGANCLELTVILKPLANQRLAHPGDWQRRCDKLINDMRAYLMAK